MFEKLWTVSDDSRYTVILWKVDKRFLCPRSAKPPKTVKVLGSKEKLTYKGSELNCDIYEGKVSSNFPEDLDVPQEVLDYTRYYEKLSLILIKIKEKTDEIVQKSRNVSETSEDSERSDGIPSLPEAED